MLVDTAALITRWVGFMQPINNSDFRHYQRTHGRGGDYLLFSDIKRVPVHLSVEGIASMRLFIHLSLDGAIPDRTTIMNFRHLPEKHKLARKILKAVNRWLSECGILMKQGTSSFSLV